MKIALSKEHGVWKHATPQELQIQEEIGQCYNELKFTVKQAKEALNALTALEQRCEALQAKLFEAQNALVERIKTEHAKCT